MRSTPRAFIILMGLALLLVSCSVEARPISFGDDQCDFCRMTIVDRQHAAQTVTRKGKQSCFDSIECMVNNTLKNGSEKELSIILVGDYGQSTMIPATTASYLITDKIKSPMGANLSAFATAEKALAAQKEYGGEIYTWNQLVAKFAR